jgi:hypothetical protein
VYIVYKIYIELLKELKLCKRYSACPDVPLSCVLYFGFRRDIYFADGVLIACVPVPCAYGLYSWC